MLLHDWSSSAAESIVRSEVTEHIDRSTYLGSLTSHNGLVSDEISQPIQKAQLAFPSCITKGRVYCSASRSVLPYGSET
ncbi:unnamed protein product [Schistosoma mattheei]|uniref:Uncharacterized protein n=1 Tax=Schistosoma mattheei TaxID=31246 RepID=A0A183NPW5_9TREM|nr:unnamed protein product [Schistosoma mattheei]